MNHADNNGRGNHVKENNTGNTGEETLKSAEETYIEQLDQMLPIDEFEEEVSENGQKVVKRGIYILPNLFTSASLFTGFYAIVSSMNDNYESAAIAIFIGMFLDAMDGRIARLTHTQSRFGAEYDSLSDMVTFGVAPALALFSWCLSSLGKLGWAAAFIYMAGAALRLARFNTQVETADKDYFTGLASPSAAAVLVASMWLFSGLGFSGVDMPDWLAWLMGAVTIAVGLLMVSNVRYYSFKGVNFKSRVPFVVLFLLILLIAIVMIDTSLVLLVASAIYMLSGPVMTLLGKRL